MQELKAEVARQIDTMAGLNQRLKGHGRIENLFEDADLQMAGYAAALRVLTGYTRIDGVDMTQEALRPRKKGEKGVVGEIIDFAVQVANEHLVPDGLTPAVWERLTRPRALLPEDARHRDSRARRSWTTTRTSPRRSGLPTTAR